ncbi:MAG: hypothetical protein WB996_12920, partial [Ignavibacteriaceae bacterium]
VPLCYNEKLTWKDEYQLSKLLNNFTRYISEFFLLFKQQITARGEFAYKQITEDENGYTINNNIEIKGTGLFSFYNKEISGSLFIDDDGNIKGIKTSENDKNIFTANAVKKEDN